MGAAIVYVPGQGVLLFGGLDNYGEYLNDTWRFAGGHWSELFPATLPLPRYGASIAYDATRNDVVLFGGAACIDAACDAAAVADDTWTWDGTDWHQMPSTLAPSPRWQAGIAYDPSTALTYLYGGCTEDCSVDSGDVWTWDGSAWSLLSASASPGPRADMGMTYDSALGDIIVFGGADPQSAANGDLGDTWTFDGTTWQQLTTSVAPEGREGSGLVYDSTRHVAVLFGGYSSQESLLENAYHRDAWTFDGSTWSQQSTTVEPDRNQDPGTVFDPDLGAAVMIGGQNFDIPVFLQSSGSGITIDEKETWTLDGSGWTQLQPTWPDDRSQDAFTYDADTGTALLTGGFCLDQPDWVCYDDWSWDGAHWTELPQQQYAASIAYAPADHELVDYAGTYVFTFDGNTWTAHPNVLASSDPEASLNFPEVASDSTGHVILFGGGVSNSPDPYPATTLRWNGTGWDRLSPTTSPPGREIGQMAYDPATQQTVLFGGLACIGSATSCTTTYYGDTWTWDGTNWTQQPTSGPPNRGFAAMAYASSLGQVVLCCGIEDDTTTGSFPVENDTWTWNGSAWTQQSPTTSPRTVLDFGLAGFDRTGQALLFGGQFDNPGWATSDEVALGVTPSGNVPESPAAWLLLVPATASGLVIVRRRRVVKRLRPAGGARRP